MPKKEPALVPGMFTITVYRNDKSKSEHHAKAEDVGAIVAGELERGIKVMKVEPMEDK